MPEMHDQHGNHSHLGPCQHGHQKRRRNESLRHPEPAWQTAKERTVMAVTGGSSWPLFEEICECRPQLAETKRISAGFEFSGHDPLAGEQHFFSRLLAESELQRKFWHAEKCGAAQH